MLRRFDPTGPLRGTLAVPPDKSISHRAALIAAMAAEPVTIRGYLLAEDTRSTLQAIRTVGAIAEERAHGEVVVRGVGLHSADAHGRTIDVGNAGTLMRLLPGWLAGQEGRSFTLDGDDSIRGRPVDRIAEPLRRLGAEIEATDGRRPPFTVHGRRLRATTYTLPVASAQVKSCVLLAGLLADGRTTVVEPTPSRDHTERLLCALGVDVRHEGDRVSVGSVDELTVSGEVVVPGDASSAAFFVAAAAIVRGSRLVLRGVNANWTRTGFFDIAERMGVVVLADRESSAAGGVVDHEPVCDLDVAQAPLQGTTVAAHEVPLAIDELPLVALLGCFADGETVVGGAAELRVKESDRIARVVEGLRGLGADIEAAADGFRVRGTGGLRGGRMAAHGDHRLAMLGAVAGLGSREGVEVDGMQAAAVSYPTFTRDLERLVAADREAAAAGGGRPRLRDRVLGRGVREG